MDSPKKAVVVALSLKAAPKIKAGISAQNSSSTKNTPSIMPSSRVNLPRRARRSRAKLTASGVSLISGGYIKQITKGIKTMATKPGNSMAKAQVVQLSVMAAPVASAINLTVKGLGAVAVINMAEVIGLAW